MVTDQVPPNDEAAELSVIGTMLLIPEQVFPLVSGLRADDFFFPPHREAWAATLAVVERCMPVDVVAVGDELRSRGMWQRFPGGWQTWASETANRATAPEIAEAHARIVQDKARLRRLIALCVEVQSAAYGAQDVDDVMARARDGVAALEVQGTVQATKICDSLSAVLAVVEDRTSGKKSHAVKTGLDNLDWVIGGMKPAQLVIVAGRPGQGKTAFAKKVALWNARHGLPVLFFSLEMETQELVERDFSLVSRVPAFAIGSGQLDVDQWRKIQDAGETLRTASLWIDDRSQGLAQICAEARRWHAREVRGKAENPEGMALVVVDYLQLVRVDRESRSENRENQVARIGRELKGLAKSLRVPVMGLCQLNREVEKRGGRPLPFDLRESGALEQDADIILFPWRDIPSDDQKARRESGPAECIVGKHRGGATGIAELYWNAPLMEFTVLDSHREPPPNWNEKE
jgi:replicative DNA helicase